MARVSTTGTTNTRRAHPTTSAKTPAHQYVHTGQNVSGKTYFPKPPKNKQKKRTTYTAPPMKGSKPAKIGAKALHEITYFQKATHLLVPKDPMERVIREIAQGLGKDSIRFQPAARRALRISAEADIVSLFEEAQILALHAKRVTVTGQDIATALRLRQQRTKAFDTAAHKLQK